LEILFFIFTVADNIFQCRLILTSFSFAHAKDMAGYDTKERKSQGFFSFLTPKHYY